MLEKPTVSSLFKIISSQQINLCDCYYVLDVLVFSGILKNFHLSTFAVIELIIFMYGFHTTDLLSRRFVELNPQEQSVRKKQLLIKMGANLVCNNMYLPSNHANRQVLYAPRVWSIIGMGYIRLGKIYQVRGMTRS